MMDPLAHHVWDTMKSKQVILLAHAQKVYLFLQTTVTHNKNVEPAMPFAKLAMVQMRVTALLAKDIEHYLKLLVCVTTELKRMENVMAHVMISHVINVMLIQQYAKSVLILSH